MCDDAGIIIHYLLLFIIIITRGDDQRANDNPKVEKSFSRRFL